MAYDLATVTNLGNQLLASVVNDHSSLVIDKIEVSGTKLTSSTDLKSMTSISNVVKTLSANGYQKKDNSFIISTVLDNSSVDADYQAWVFGIWAHKADGGSSILMSVITSTNSPDTISKGSGTPIDYNYKFITTFSNTKSLKIKMSSDTYATNDTVLHNSGDETATGTKTFQEIKISNKKFPSLVQTDGQYVTLDGGNTEIVPADNSKVVHTTGDETIDGKKKFDTDPTDSAGNAYAKTVDVNQQLDKKVNVADMRKPASDVAGIEEVNVKQDKIGYTPADDSKVVHNSVIDPSVIFKRVLTPADDVLMLDPGIYCVWGVTPKNYPTSINNYARVVVKMFSGLGISTGNMIVEVFDAFNNQMINIYQGYPMAWSGWKVPNSNTMASKSDVSAATANKADDSKVVHTTDTSNWQKQAMFNPGDFKMDETSPTTDFATLLKSKYNKAGIVYIRDNDYPSRAQIINAVVICEGGNWWYAYGITSGSGDFVHRKINSDFDTGWVINADDSKVAHLSGANNFDTVPTVKNNPLLLASSLPSDLARTGQANTFNLTQTFSQGVKTLQTGSYDDANSLVNEGLYFNTNLSIKNGAGSITTGYIKVMSGYEGFVRQLMYSDTDASLMYTRASQTGGSSWSDWIQIITSGQDIARTGQSQTFTAAQTFSSAPTVLDTSSSKGDNQVALMGDLKSLEESAWRRLDNKYITNSADGNSFQEANNVSNVLYQINKESSVIYFSFTIFTTTINAVSIRIDFSSIVKNIYFPSDRILSLSSITSDNKTFQISIANNQIQTGTTPNSDYICSLASYITGNSIPKRNVGICYVCYDELV